jgi:hypothetical protein
VLDVSQSAANASRYSRYPLECPLEYPLEYHGGYSIKGRVCEGLGAGAPVGAGADESASLRLIKTGRLPICKRRHLGDRPERHRRGGRASYFKQVIHIEWLIRT